MAENGGPERAWLRAAQATGQGRQGELSWSGRGNTPRL